MQAICSFGSKLSSSFRKSDTENDLLQASRQQTFYSGRSSNVSISSSHLVAAAPTASATDNKTIKSCLKKRQSPKTQHSQYNQVKKVNSTSSFASTDSVAAERSTVDSQDNQGVNGGHYGHFAEVTFRWSYPAMDKPKLYVLHQGKVVYTGELNLVEAMDKNNSVISDDDLGEHIYYELHLAVRAVEEYDYFFEVDGELRYDFDCDYDEVEVLEVASGMGTCGVPSIGAPMKAMTLSEGQIIIANQIQICEPEDALNLSMSQSTTSSSDTSTNNEWLGSAPVVAWPLGLASLVEQAKPVDSTMVMPMMPPTPPAAMAEATATGAAISMYCDFTDSSSFSGKQQSTKDLTTTTTGITTTTISSFNSSSASSNNNSMLKQIKQLKNTKIAKRVHFWDAYHHQQHAGQTATAADGAGNVVVVSVGSVAF